MCNEEPGHASQGWEVRTGSEGSRGVGDGPGRRRLRHPWRKVTPAPLNSGSLCYDAQRLLLPVRVMDALASFPH